MASRAAPTIVITVTEASKPGSPEELPLPGVVVIVDADFLYAESDFYDETTSTGELPTEGYASYSQTDITWR